MRYRTAAAFDRDFARLPAEHQRLFLAALREVFLPAISAGSLTGTPLRLRLHRLHGTQVYSITWNFSSPDGRATYHVETVPGDEPVLVWRRIGGHGIYDRP